MGQLNQRVEAVLLNTNLSDTEREYLRGELGYGLYIIALPTESIESADLALALLYTEEEGNTDGT